MSEQDLVNAIIDYIVLRGGLATRINSGMRVIKGESGKSRVFKGAPAGTSDIIACIAGRYVAIECKLPGNKPTDKQTGFLRDVADAGGVTLCAYSLDDVIKLYDCYSWDDSYITGADYRILR